MDPRMPLEVLLVEDNPADVRLMEELFEPREVSMHLHVVSDGIEALAHLRGKGGGSIHRRPDLILLDLNLPRMSGPELLETIKSDSDLQVIPVISLSTSKADLEVLQTYRLHVNSYLKKPEDLDAFIQMLRALECFWFRTAVLPPR